MCASIIDINGRNVSYDNFTSVFTRRVVCVQSSKEKKEKTKKKKEKVEKEEKAEEAAPAAEPAAAETAPAPAEEPAEPAAAPAAEETPSSEPKEDKEETKEERREERREEKAHEPKRAQRATSNVFALFNQAQIQEFKEVHKRSTVNFHTVDVNVNASRKFIGPQRIIDRKASNALRTPVESSSLSSSQVFLKWPKQQRHHEDHDSQSKYRQYQSAL